MFEALKKTLDFASRSAMSNVVAARVIDVITRCKDKQANTIIWVVRFTIQHG